jgi:hypothetical protein
METWIDFLPNLGVNLVYIDIFILARFRCGYNLRHPPPFSRQKMDMGKVPHRVLGMEPKESLRNETDTRNRKCETRRRDVSWIICTHNFIRATD